MACSPKPTIGIEAVLDGTGLSAALLDRAKDETGAAFNVVVDESRALLEKLKNGELDLVLANDDLGTDTLLREGIAGSAEPFMHTEVVFVGPEKDPLAIHTERTLKSALRLLLDGEGAFFRCVPCGTRAREDAIFAQLPDLPHRRGSFIDVGQTEADIVRAMQSSPGYGFLARATVLHRMKHKEWSFMPLWSGDPLLVDTYRVIVRPVERIDADKRAAVEALRKFLVLSEPAKALIKKHGAEELGQPYFAPGAPGLNEAARF